MIFALIAIRFQTKTHCIWLEKYKYNMQRQGAKYFKIRTILETLGYYFQTLFNQKHPIGLILSGPIQSNIYTLGQTHQFKNCGLHSGMEVETVLLLT
jgi:hypothetical protein